MVGGLRPAWSEPRGLKPILIEAWWHGLSRALIRTLTPQFHPSTQLRAGSFDSAQDRLLRPCPDTGHCRSFPSTFSQQAVASATSKPPHLSLHRTERQEWGTLEFDICSTGQASRLSLRERMHRRCDGWDSFRLPFVLHGRGVLVIHYSLFA